MKKDELEKRIDKLLNEEETFLLSLVLLAQMHSDPKYKNLSELIFLFDNLKKFKQFIKYFEGTDVYVPTVKELKQALRLLDLFQKVKIDKRNFEVCYNRLKLKDLGLTEEYCLQEIDKFYKYLQKEGSITIKQFKRLPKSNS